LRVVQLVREVIFKNTLRVVQPAS